MNIFGAIRLVSTEGLEKEEWLKYRQRGIGGSDAGAILGVNKYRSAMEVYMDKLSDTPNEIPDNEAMRQGRDLEDYVAKRFCDQEGKTVRRCKSILQHSEYPFLIADVDRIVDGENAILECKTASSFLNEKYKKDDVPLSYIFQCYHYMMVCPKVERVYLAVLIYGLQFKVYTIEREQEQIAALQEREIEWWTRHIIGKEMPEPDGSESCQKMLNTMFDAPEGEKNLSSNCELLLKELEASENEARELDKRCVQIKQAIQKELGNAEVGLTETFRVNWKQVKGRETFDKKRFVSEHPHVLDEYIKQGAPSRRFTYERMI